MKIILFISTSLLVMLFSQITSAQSLTTNATQLNRTINQFQLVKTPLAEAIDLIGDVVAVEILIDRVAISDEIDLSRPVTLNATDVSVKDLLRQILPPSLVAATQGKSIIITTKKRLASGKRFDLQDAKQLATTSDVSTGQVLQQRMPLHFEQMPLEMVVQMIGGIAGKQVAFAKSARDKRFAFVSVHRDNATLKESLDDLLDQHELSYDIEGRTLLIRTKDN